MRADVIIAQHRRCTLFHKSLDWYKAPEYNEAIPEGLPFPRV